MLKYPSVKAALGILLLVNFKVLHAKILVILIAIVVAFGEPPFNRP